METPTPNGDRLPIIFESEHFIAMPCRDVDLPGYIILRTKAPIARFDDLPAEALRGLGSALQLLESAVLNVTGAERVYILRFSEGTASVHFHVFPRTLTLAHRWQESDPIAKTLAGLYGEYIYGWSRTAHKVVPNTGLSAATLNIAEAIRSFIRRSAETHSP